MVILLKRMQIGLKNKLDCVKRIFVITSKIHLNENSNSLVRMATQSFL